LNLSDRLYFSKYALDSNFNAYSNELDIFDFEDDPGQSRMMVENNLDEFEDDLREE
jgi:hypothetical protein